LLSEPEKHLFGQLAVFSGGWTLEAAKAGCDPFVGGTLPEGLTLLAEKNLIQQIGEGADLRWRMLVTIHEFALVQLTALPDVTAPYARHAQYYSDYVASIRKELDSAKAPELLGLLNLEDDNIQAALSWSLIEAPKLSAANLRTNSINAGAVLAVSMNRPWSRSGRIQEGLKWYGKALKYQAMLPLSTGTELLNMLGYFNELVGDYAQAETSYLEALALAQRLEDVDLMGRTLLNLGICASRQTNFQKAHEYYSYSINYAREAAGDTMSPLLYWGLHNLALVEKNLGDLSLARELMEEVLLHARKTGDPHRIAGALAHLGMFANLEGDYETARRHNMDALSLNHNLDDKIGTCGTIYGIAEAWRGLGQFEISARLFGMARALQDKMGIIYSIDGESEINREQSILSNHLGDKKVNQLMAEGAVMTIDEAVAYALQPS
jgi:tetratricopeptide (TPR) repeat protein